MTDPLRRPVAIPFSAERFESTFGKATFDAVADAMARGDIAEAERVIKGAVQSLARTVDFAGRVMALWHATGDPVPFASELMFTARDHPEWLAAWTMALDAESDSVGQAGILHAGVDRVLRMLPFTGEVEYDVQRFEGRLR